MAYLPEQAQRIIDSARRVIEQLLYSQEEIHLRERDQEMLALLARGKVSAAEILRADFGTFPAGLKGQYPDFPVTFTDLRETEKYKNSSEEEKLLELATVGGRGGASERVYLRPEYFDKNMQMVMARGIADVISHETIHRLQGIQREAGWNSAFDNRHMGFLSHSKPVSNIRDGIIQLYETFSRRAVDNKALKETKNPEMTVSNYFAKDYEVQARFHEMMAHGYAGWRKLPVTKTELWAALHNYRLPTPDKIRRHLQETEEGQRALRDFRVSAKRLDEMQSERRALAHVNDYAFWRETSEQLWEKAYPKIYGNLLELYGDQEVRPEFGKGINPAPAIDLLLKVEHATAPLTPDIADALVLAVPAGLAPDLLRVLSARYPDGHHGVPAKTADMIIEAMFASPDHRAALTAQKALPLDAPVSLLSYAAITKQEKLLDRLLAAGVDPEQERFIIPGAAATGNRFLSFAETLTRHKAMQALQPGYMTNLTDWFNGVDSRAQLRASIETIEGVLQLVINKCPNFYHAHSEIFTAAGMAPAETAPVAAPAAKTCIS